jgi:hypothetical protein
VNARREKDLLKSIEENLLTRIAEAKQDRDLWKKRVSEVKSEERHRRVDEVVLWERRLERACEHLQKHTGQKAIEWEDRIIEEIK